MFFLPLTTWDDLDILLTLSSTWGFYLNHVTITQAHFECAYNVLLEHGELPCVLPFDFHLDLGHLPDTQGYLGLLPEPCTPGVGLGGLGFGTGLDNNRYLTIICL